MPFKERFQARPCGRAFNAVLEVKLSVSSWTAAEATRISFGYWLSVLGDSFSPIDGECNARRPVKASGVCETLRR